MLNLENYIKSLHILLCDNKKFLAHISEFQKSIQNREFDALRDQCTLESSLCNSNDICKLKKYVCTLED